MNYYVVMADGQKFGPAPIETLNQWIAENRLQPTSMLEDAATGQQLMANTVPGLNFPMSAPMGGPSMPGGFPEPPANPFQNPPSGAAYPRGGGQAYASSGDAAVAIRNTYIFAALSFFCCPLIFGYFGWKQADKAEAMGHPGAKTARTVLLVCAIASFVIGAISRLSTMRH